MARFARLAVLAATALAMFSSGNSAVRADVVADMNANVPSTVGFTTDYTLNIGGGNAFAGGVPYTIDNSSLIAAGSFTRIGYYLELGGSSNYNNGWVYVEFNAAPFSASASQLGVPIDSTGEYYHYGLANGQVVNMTVESNVPGIVTGTGITTGAVQFWPSNYGTNNDYGVPNPAANSNGVFDFADGGSGHGTGYGAMQINNYGAQQTIFAFNNWNGGGGDLGIGNNPVGGNPNYTFENNAGSYSLKSMAIVVNSTGGLPIWTNSTSDGLWGTAANWANGVVPDAAGAQANLGQQTNGSTVDLGSTSRTVGGLVFSPTTNTTLMSSGGATLIFDNSGSPSAINVLGGNHAISSPVALNNDLSFAGSSGSLTLSGGITSFGHNLSLDGNITLNLDTANPNISGGNFSVNNGTVNENASGGFGAAHVNLNAGTINMNVAGDAVGSSADINGGVLNIWQPMNLANTSVHANGSLQLVADQSAAGGVAPNNAIQGSVNLFADQGVGYNLKMDNGSTLQASNGTRTFAGNLALTSAGGTTNLGTSGNNLNLTGAISGTGGLTQNGTGTTTLSGPLSYQGATNVNAGTLALQSSLTGGGNVNVGGGATLNIGANGSLGTSALSTGGLTTLTANNASLGSGPVGVTSGGELRFDTGAGNTGNYTGTSITLNNANLHVATGSANLGTAVITGNVAGLGPGMEGQYWANQNPPNVPINGQPNTFPDNGTSGPLHTYLAQLPAPNVTQVLPETGNGVQGWNGGVNFQNNGYGGNNAFAPIGVNVGTSNVVSDWTATIHVTTAGSYSFSTTSDDASMLYVNGQLVVNNNGGHGAQTASGSVILAAGNYSIEVPFTQGGGGWGVLATYQGPGMSNAAVVGVDTPGEISFATAVPGSTINVDSGTSLTAGAIASAQQLNLNGTLSLNSTSASVSNVVNASVAAPAILNLGANNSFSANSTTITDGNSLTLTGAGRFNVQGGQTMTIGTTNATTALNVNGGVFHVDGTVSGPGLVNVNSGGSIGGAGSLNLAVHINSGGTLAPGDAANLTVASLALADNSNMTYNLNIAGVEHLTYNPANGNDLTTVTGTNGLAISSSTYSAGSLGTTVNVIGGSNFGFGTYELLAYTGAFSGSLSSFGIGVAPSGFKYEFVNLANAGGGGGQIDLMVVPEPSTVVLMVLGLVGLAFSSRRRWAKRAA